MQDSRQAQEAINNLSKAFPRKPIPLTATPKRLEPCFGGSLQVLEYLGRYTHRVAISNQRILALDGIRLPSNTRITVPPIVRNPGA